MKLNFLIYNIKIPLFFIENIFIDLKIDNKKKTKIKNLINYF